MLKLMQLKRELLAKNMCVVLIIMKYINFVILKTEDFDIFISIKQILEFFIKKLILLFKGMNYFVTNIM